MVAGFNLVGVYITDDRIDVHVGRDPRPNVTSLRVVDMSVECSAHEGGHFVFAKHGVEGAFAKAREWIRANSSSGRTLAVGCYGPFESISREDRGKSSYGKVRKTTSPRRLLSGHNVVSLLAGDDDEALRCERVTIVPDVTAAAIGELYLRYTDDGLWRDHKERPVLAFIKASIGLGAAVIKATEPWEGVLHPEFGQVRVERWPGDEGFHGACRYHGSCLEGLAAVPGIEKRYFPATFEQLLADRGHDCWEREAFYLAQGCIAATSLWAPGKIIIGGRIMRHARLLTKIRKWFRQLYNTRSYQFYPQMGLPDYIDTDYHYDRGPSYPGALGALCIAALEARGARQPVRQERR